MSGILQFKTDLSYLAKPLPFLDGSLNAQTINWANRVVVNGGATPSTNTQIATSTFWNSIQAAGLDLKCIAVSLFVPDSLIACITPFYFTKGSDPWVNHSFVSGDLSANGLKGNKTTNPYLSTGVRIADLAGNNSISMAFANIKDSGVGEDGTFQCGESDGSLITGAFLGRNSISSGYFFMTGGAGGVPTNCANAGVSTNGFWVGSRQAANDIKIYRGDSTTAIVQKASNTVSGAAIGANTNVINVFSIDLAGTSVNFDTTADSISFYWIGSGLTSTDVTNLYNAVKTFRQDPAINGGFV